MQKKLIIFILFSILIITGVPWLFGKYLMPEIFETTRYIIKYHIATAMILFYVLQFSLKNLWKRYSIPLIGISGIIILLIPGYDFIIKEIIIILHVIYAFIVFIILARSVVVKKAFQKNKILSSAK